MNSVRTRTTLVGVAVVTMALILGGAGLVLALDRVLVRETDLVSRAQADTLAGLAVAGDLPPVLASLGEDTFAQVLDASGAVRAATPEALGQPAITFESPDPVSVRAVDARAPDGDVERYRVWRVLRESPNGRIEVVVGRDLESIHDVLVAMSLILAVGLPLGVGAAGFVVWRLVGRALRPVEQIRSEVAAITANRLTDRVTVPEADDEVARLAVTMNELLDRIDQAYGRQRQFVADASHELQSPLTSFRAQLEIALAHPERADWPETARSLLAESSRMEKIVSDLLFLAVTDAAEEGPPDALVDFDEVVADEVGRPRMPSGVSVRLSRITPASVRGRPDELGRLVRNLLDNAVHHAESRVELTLDVNGSEVRFQVHDDGPGIPADQQERIFDRFWRAEAARSPTSGGTGLGLPIARSIAERHGGTLVVDTAASGGCFTVTLPLASLSVSAARTG